LDLWRQPKIILKKGAFDVLDVSTGFSEKELHQINVGGSLSFIGTHRIKKSSTSFFLQMGYKTKGFLPGESLKDRFIIKLGFAK
jgi:hypothetical protein